jgi:two-component system chemotaxis response regulator CheB
MLNVLVVDDSAVARRLIAHIIGSQSDMRVAGEARDGEEALRLVKTLDPDVITMDIRMPVLDGYQATTQIMESGPKPIIMVSAHEPAEIARSFRAIDAGALMVLRKPVGMGAPGADQIATELVEAIRSVAGLKLVTRRHRAPDFASTVTVAPVARPRTERIELLAIASSTGGPAAVSGILRRLPASLPVGCLLVQHIADGFDAGFASYLDSVTELDVRLASAGDRIQPGLVLVAPNGSHLTVGPDSRIRLVDEAPIGGHRPSATPLFASVASVYGARALGVILTGIGRDGCDGLAELHAAGGRVIAQDEATSVVWGMPRAAVEAGIVDEILGIDRIPDAIQLACQRGRSPA